MNKLAVLLSGALLYAAPLFSQKAPVPGPDPRLDANRRLIWLSVNDSKPKVAQVMGRPRMRTEFGADFQSWQYQIGEGDHDDSSHLIVFRKSTGAFVSITRNYEPQRNVAAFFPEKESSIHIYQTPDGVPFSILVRKLDSTGLLLAPGLSHREQLSGQLMLIHKSELQHFYPWLAKQIADDERARVAPNR